MDAPSLTTIATPPAARPLRKRPWFRLAMIPTVIYVFWCAGLYLGQGKILFRLDLVSSLRPEQVNWLRTGERLSLELNDKSVVEAYFFPAPSASAQRPAPCVVFLHGNAETAGQQSWMVQHYHDLGCSVLLPEYRGYAGCGGKPSQAGIVADARFFLDEASKRPDVDPSRMVIHGRSLGGGVAAQLAARHKPAALILESTFTSIAGMAHRYLAPEWLVSNPFRTDQVLPTLDIPVLIFHGTHDRVVPLAHAHRNRELTRRCTMVEYDCDHDDLPGVNAAAYWEQIRAFLAAGADRRTR